MHLELTKLRRNDIGIDLPPRTLVLISIRDHATLREMYGQTFIDLLDKTLVDTLAATAKANDAQQTVIHGVGPGTAAFLVPRDNNPADTAYEYKIQAQNGLENIMLRHTGLGIDLGMGYASVQARNNRDDAIARAPERGPSDGAPPPWT